jgi:ribosomal protein L29
MADKKLSYKKDLKNLSVKELVELRKDLRKRLFELKMQNQARTLKQTHLIPLVKRNIARVNTAITLKIKELAKENPSYASQLSKKSRS